MIPHLWCYTCGMVDNSFSDWEPNLHWDTPCGRSLNKLIDIFKNDYKEDIGIFLTAGSWFQMVVDPTEKTKDVDVIICRRGKPGELVPIENKEIHDSLLANGIGYKIENLPLYRTGGVLPYIDVLEPSGLIISHECTGRASCTSFDNVSICVLHPADWVAMHTPSELQARGRVKRTIKTLKRPTEREYIRAVDDIGNKSIVLRPRFCDPIPVSIAGYEVKEVLAQIRMEQELSSKSIGFGI